jgi:signal peptidase I
MGLPLALLSQRNGYRTKKDFLKQKICLILAFNLINVNIIELLILFVLFIILPYAGLWKMFEKAKQPGWMGIVPIVNIYIMIKLSGRPAWWIVLALIPVINILVLIGITIDFVKSFGKFKLSEHAGAVLLPFIFLYKWGSDKETKYIGPATAPEFKEKNKAALQKSSSREWTEAIIFAVIAATLIRTFFIEAYVIPTPSMERSLLVGDFLFVSKVNYGARTPMTPIAFPFAHHTMPVTGTKAYWDGWELPYYRLPGLQEIKRGDVVVFNYPADTINDRPVDKRENYIKRCQGIPGDTLSVVDAQVYVNGKAAPNPPGEEMEYNVTTTNGRDLKPEIMDKLDITVYDQHNLPAMTATSASQLKNNPTVKDLKPDIAPKSVSEDVFPRGHVSVLDPNLGTPLDYHWNVDNYGPIIIPKKGWTVTMDAKTFPIYERAIQVYEHNTLELKDGYLYINGVKTYSYTFKLNYYWMMGDNRHDSEDSRYWGFVPEDHIVGKALFIWMSWDDKASSIFHKIRWGRLFNGIH